MIQKMLLSCENRTVGGVDMMVHKANLTAQPLEDGYTDFP